MGPGLGAAHMVLSDLLRARGGCNHINLGKGQILEIDGEEQVWSANPINDQKTLSKMCKIIVSSKCPV